MAIDSAFWLSPPWAGSGGKHRLALRPISSAPVSAPTPATLANKQRQLAERYKQVVACLPDSLPAQAELGRQPWFQGAADHHPDPIANLALTVEEDLCLLDVADGNRLVAACVCAPSYWRLAEKIGQPLTVIHEPVDGMNAKIGANIARFFRQMPEAQTFVRQNWFLHGDSGLFQYDDEDFTGVAQSQWVIRSEFQSLHKLTPNLVLFGIRISCEPASDIFAHPDALASLQTALARMDSDEITHFGGVTKHRALTEYLRRGGENADSSGISETKQ